MGSLAHEKQDISDFDVIIIGAGISGINAAYRVQTQAPAGTRYTILEARDGVEQRPDLSQ